ncbi:alcohol acetyltransferase [Trichococcus ilyis]|uniref:Alcohol acetyltransferase n=1 Tax=Trichococcus ilyis TaxID=640938 RepID=A0A143Z9B3_9LACT|nr:alcohol acetyltransferase [Trichococcus ilyis]CZR07506.1 alcohol acetyltransferase [Trichococcus ilyis]SEJ74020.1 Alcohol acetyltransferase [Trichococcus ilyis]
MDRKKWVRLDNASNIFLAAMTNTDTKVFRMSAELNDAVDPQLLQKALDEVYENYVLYHSVLRRGFFWYYLEESDLKPKVTADVLPPCAQIYHFDRRELLFRVFYNQNRVHLELFHALSDGTGALWFFEDLLKAYIMLRHPEAFKGLDATAHDRLNHQLEDSFAHYFRKDKKQSFADAAQSAIRSVAKVSQLTGKSSAQKNALPQESEHQPKLHVHRYRGKKTPDNRPHVIELELPVKAVLALARENQTSLTLFLTAVYMLAVRKASPDFRPGSALAVSIPVNLRQFFPSNSARNFFSATRLVYRTDETGADEIAGICRTLQEQFRQQITPESLEDKLRTLIAFEYSPFTRMVFRPIKDLVLKLVNYISNRNLTIAISNLGKVVFPEPIDAYIGKMYFHTSAVRPQFCAISHGEHLTVSFTSPFVESTIQEQFVRILTDAGVAVTVAANKVTSEDLEVEG